MTLVTNFIIGFLASFIGVIPPGLLNMSAAKISMKEGRKVATLFSVGVCVTVMIQTFVALVLARYLDKNPDIIDALQKVALGIFICLTIFFFFIAKDTRRETRAEIKKSKTNRFFKGMFIAALNLLPLPYWVYISITFSAFGWFSFEQLDLWIAVVASGLGTFAMLMIYIQFFKLKPKKIQKKNTINMNYVIGAITAVIAIVTAVKILNSIV
ncbi:lysine transporter LysE [Patiriisocius marinistellae]|uniref:Lysine transporter LysE n=1 Tax=Patiriisocius marinistellae TaxID=2494560 RepID=A0A5J4FT05_9FLAO|nr:LysE family transporter [Patiriisocius marinistellae]GEQ84563.1 lysine transporter LysE [Patiriisocius marinistellae]